MKRRCSFVFAVLSSLSLPLAGTAQIPDSVQRFADSALRIMQRHSVFAAKVDWASVKDTVAFLLKGAKNYSQTATALRYAFNQLGDKHGYVVIDGEAYHNPAFVQAPLRVNENMALAASKGARIYAGSVQGFAYLSIPFFSGQSREAANAFAQRLQDSLCRILNKGVKGLILDLRLNAGGFTQAMLVGVSNVFGNQKLAPAKPYAGDWVIEDYGINVNDSFRIQLKKACGDFSRLPVAVLIGPQTASAGEFLALGFAARRKTVLIGERTAGYTSGNNGFLLPGTGNGIVVAEEYAVDKKGRIYTDGIDPQIKVTGGDDFFNREHDAKVMAATAWLKKQRR